MLMLRRFSSGSRSVSTPVSALTSVVLPWSLWPADPTIIDQYLPLFRRRSLERGAECRKLRRQQRRLFEAAQIEQQPVFADATDHRQGQRAQRAREFFEQRASTLQVDRLHREARRWKAL